MSNRVPVFQPPGQNQADYDSIVFEQIAAALENSGYAVLCNALPDTVIQSLLDALSKIEFSDFHPAAIGRKQARTRDASIRRDRIFWIDSDLVSARPWLLWCEKLRCHLNGRLFLGLSTFESHFGCYGPGDFYRKHLDAFSGRANRVLSLATYLNSDWHPDQGGELVLYDPADPQTELLRISPAIGTLVLFLSEEYPHEVLPATRERFSVAGWFRSR